MPMTDTDTNSNMTDQYISFLDNDGFPCIAAKAAVARQQVKCMVADHLACPKDDVEILQFLYHFVDTYRQSNQLYHSAAIIFKQPEILDEAQFDEFLWMRLQALSDLDAQNYNYDNRVDSDPRSAEFSFSLKEEAFFIIGLHPASSRLTRRFAYPVLTFNPHAQFEDLRTLNKFENMKKVVRKRDINYSGSMNPMLDNYGTTSEVNQYSGQQYDDSWECPLNIKNGKTKPDSAS